MGGLRYQRPFLDVILSEISGDQPVDRIIRCLCGKGYIRNLKKNLRALEREMEDLRANKDDVQNKVAREETRHQQRLKAVQVWLTRVDSIDLQIKNLLSTCPVQLQKLCLCGLCSKNVCSSYSYGKMVFLLLEDVKSLKSEGNFEVVAEPAQTFEFEERPTQPTIGQDIMLETAWNRLMKDGIGIMGLHGMGGVGKTTLFKRLHNKFAEIAGSFDVVIWIVVSQGTKISKLQEDIAQKLDLCGDEWTNKNESDKATKIHRVLQGKRFVLMLDDIWEKVDLEAIGVPFPTSENGCKVAFTTRSREVCGRMGDHEPMQVKCLERDEAWELFKNKVGEKTLTRDPIIAKLARKVAEKCHGLPLALNVIGETMASKNKVQEWEHAIDVLTKSAAEFSDMENKILPILKYSYDSLVDEHIKSCFLYCALFPEDYQIGKERLIDYWICEGFIGEYQVVKRAKNKGYEVLGTLIRANLLTEIHTKLVVMHDVVREMALWIASDFGKQKESLVVQARVGLQEVPNVKDWGAVKRMSLMNNDIKEITCGSKCSELTTLFLQNNYDLINLSGEFIRSMQKLVVLDLSRTRINELPEEISALASLQFLDLSGTTIEIIPVGFQRLKKLTHLNLSRTHSLCSMGGILKLPSLRVLKLEDSNVVHGNIDSKYCSDETIAHAEVSFVKKLQLLEHLQVLTITLSTDLGLKQILGDHRLANCISGMHMRNFRQKPLNISLLASMVNLCELSMGHTRVSEINTYKTCRESRTDWSDVHNPTSPCFTNLTHVSIFTCTGIKDLTWLLFAPNLVYLDVDNSDEVEEIIKKEKATDLIGITPFQKLEELYVQNLPKLESIYWSPLPFQSLRRITVEGCPKLRKLPLNATSVPRLGEFTIAMAPWNKKYLGWEDEDTKNRFLPFIEMDSDSSLSKIRIYASSFL